VLLSNECTAQTGAGLPIGKLKDLAPKKNKNTNICLFAETIADNELQLDSVSPIPNVSGSSFSIPGFHSYLFSN
jgi:hypothetical protein